MSDILNKQNLTDLNKALLALHDAFTLTDRLENVGEDVTALRAELVTWKEKLEAYKREFFPQSR